jgi:YD repeat-containing protein
LGRPCFDLKNRLWHITIGLKSMPVGEKYGKCRIRRTYATVTFGTVKPTYTKRMTHTYFSRPGLWVAGLLLTLMLGCSKSSTDAVAPADPTCQLTTVNYQNPGENAPSQTVYTYDAQGLLVSSVQSSSLGGKVSGTTTSTYTYDANGYQTAYKATYFNGSKSYINEATTYEYTNSRLTKSSSSYSDNFDTVDRVYSYDAGGNLTATTSTINFPQYPDYKNTTTFSFTNGALTSGTITGSDGKPLPYTIGSGRITASPGSSGAKTRYTYDASGHNTKVETVNAAGVVTEYTTYEFATAPIKGGPSISFKGFPTFSLYGTADLPISHQVDYRNGTVFEDTQYQYQTNSKGYLTSRTKKVTGNTVSQSSLTYTYSNCQ